MPLMKCDDLAVGYDNHTIVKNVTFSVAERDYLYIVGENGSGKSTLLKTLVGLLKPLHGAITFPSIQKTEIGYLPQQSPMQKDFPTTVFEVVLSGRLNHLGFFPFYRQADKDIAMKNLALLEIMSLKNHSYRDLSGGQQQRVLLARALCATSKMIFLDEPTAGLDPKISAELYEIIHKLNHEQGIAIVIVSHDIEHAIQYGTRIIHVMDGTVHFHLPSDYAESDFYHRLRGRILQC